MKLTRRELAAALTAAAAAAQTPAPPRSPEAELESARSEVKTIQAALQQVGVPMATEPSFAFHP